MKIMLLYNFYARLRILYDCCLQFSFDTPPSFQENQDTDGVMTNDDILGDEIPRDQQEAMRQFCYQSLKLPPGVGMLKVETIYLFACCWFSLSICKYILDLEFGC